MSFCAAFNNHLCVTLESEIEFTPCCRFNKPHTFSYPVKDYSFAEYKKNTEELNSMTNWIPGCNKCMREENAGITSLRQRYNLQQGNKDGIVSIELSLSNDCNISCKMCSPKFSSKWQSLLEKNPDNLSFWMQPNKLTPVTLNQIFDGVDLSKVERIKYLGGEPFITTEFHDLMVYLDSKVDLSKVKMMCNTNATFFPQKLLPIVFKFKSFILNISLDGIGDLCNFVRTGSQWETVESVIKKWQSIDNVNLFIFNTSQAYNIHQFETIKQYAKDNGIQHIYNILSTPEYLSYSVLPDKYRKYLIDQSIVTDQMILSYLENTMFDSKLFEKFKMYTKDTDMVLGTSFEKTIPELYKHIVAQN